ncbi:MAG: hypothetical protein A3E21_08985 [Sulfurimonas sp. RIFCSPHIGHO2_12_FULL_36_9]|uniref:hypothetical protein n=1 Tax=Sulfurimonas sp. RIFCSPLOWO2_12_36_12 TaxID=1802253 RepID=UPI0008C451D9|nr:hypothetical protein [Sulfurimonas sp. RIFCSPLOWO2_12_36_12]OHD97415.1 MAG: hypothetical protein A3J26_04090 [Sulfurimonas sp. RIFCSPLOWO2_02_FULL_36_28]OHD99652.1 MAG: hypothetical protein A3E21_08985 [Sulfurimonas sp. RIFCSPHIGHO2_12_FULL_36_9]OHE01971.1 MAG: hypothetical protein A2W82_01550 [Sulfurimonas sp. RIFCSPLOWO2_12_36_12]OHE05700.1 MAG: hypothetical protein A3K14_01405 [Sulfurimonas sp. RIFCSPLOWO2_12_FULL_36_74]
MHIKKYTIAALILMILVGWYIFAFITQESKSIEFFGLTLPSLSIAILAVIPMIILFIASVLHMSFYSLLSALKLRKYEKDYEKIVDAIVDAYLGKENRSNSFKTEKYKLLGFLVDNATIFPTAGLDSEVNNKKINNVLSIINGIRSGDVVDLRKYSLPSSNALVIQNERNRYKKGTISAEDILNGHNKYDISLRKEVYTDFVKKAPLNAIEKYRDLISKESLFEILSRINADTNTLVVSNESLISFFEDLKLTSKDYIEASKKLSKSMLPEQRIKLFETLSNENDIVVEAYLFTLFDLEMLTPAKEILDISQPNEYAHFKAYSSLRECGKHFDINLFI